MMDMPEGLDCLRRREGSTEVCRGCLKVIACGGATLLLPIARGQLPGAWIQLLPDFAGCSVIAHDHVWARRHRHRAACSVRKVFRPAGLALRHDLRAAANPPGD